MAAGKCRRTEHRPNWNRMLLLSAALLAFRLPSRRSTPALCRARNATPSSQVSQDTSSTDATSSIRTHFLPYNVSPDIVLSPVCTPTELTAPCGLTSSIARSSAFWCPTTSSVASAPRPSVASRTACAMSSGANALAPCFSASCRRAGLGSTARTVEKRVVADVIAHRPTFHLSSCGLPDVYSKHGWARGVAQGIAALKGDRGMGQRSQERVHTGPQPITSATPSLTCIAVGSSRSSSYPSAKSTLLPLSGHPTPPLSTRSRSRDNTYKQPPSVEGRAVPSRQHIRQQQQHFQREAVLPQLIRHLEQTPVR